MTKRKLVKTKPVNR